MKVEPTKEVFYNGQWYKPGDELPLDYTEKQEKLKKEKEDNKNLKSEVE